MMVMKDKLTKRKHSPLFYSLQKVGFFLLAVGTIAPCIAIPTYFSIQENNNREANLAQEVEEEFTETDKDEVYYESFKECF